MRIATTLAMRSSAAVSRPERLQVGRFRVAPNRLTARVLLWVAVTHRNGEQTMNTSTDLTTFRCVATRLSTGERIERTIVASTWQNAALAFSAGNAGIGAVEIY
jgi:hypothetical protein